MPQALTYVYLWAIISIDSHLLIEVVVMGDEPAEQGRSAEAARAVPGAGEPALQFPESCTLPTAARPLRAAEFDGFLAAAVRGVDRTAPTRLRLDLAPGPQAAARAAELAAAESGCCSFFTFTLTVTGGALTLDVAVPDPHVPLLDALAERALERCAQPADPRA
jgi:hypothetical protein